MSIGSVTASGSPFVVGATRNKPAAQNDEVCQCDGHTYFKKDEEFFAQAFGRELKWPITSSPKGLIPQAEAIVRLHHQQAYKAGQTFDTGKFIQNASRWYPDSFNADLVNKAASFFGGTSSHGNQRTFWA